MGFLVAVDRVVMQMAARVMTPPPPPDITRWCEENIVFDERSPMPGPFRIDRFPFLREIHECLSPEHPSREVTIRGSAQWGKTVSVGNPLIGAWHEYGPLDSLVVHPTTSSAEEWVRTKWLPMRRKAPSLLRVFGDGRSGDQTDTLKDQETLRRDGSLKVVSAGSPDDLAGTTRRLVLMDDLSKFEMTQKGDPEQLAMSRASAFEDAKIVRISTPQIAGTCRISRAYQRSDRREYHVPCPHCGDFAPLTWENFRKNINPERLHAAHFTCESCGAEILHADKEKMVLAGRWVATNPGGDHPGFHLWRAYVPQRDWASIAVEYAQVMGWQGMTLTKATEAAMQAQAAAETEQTFWNDVLGLPYEQASKGPDWQALRDRVENADPEQMPVLPRGILPADGFILTAGVDCQLDRTEVHIVAFGRNYRRWAIDYIVIPHHIGDEACRASLDALLKATWKTERGLAVRLDMMAIDVGTYTEDVWSFGKRHPWDRVILVKGSSRQVGPIIEPMRFERRVDGKAKKAQRRAFLVNVSQMKADFFGWLAKDDPLARGFCHFAAGLGDEYYRQITSEVRVLTRNRQGVVTSQWEKADASRRNEGLDTMNYAEAAARRKGWAAMTDAQWADLEAERSATPPEAQADLFDGSVQIAPPAHAGRTAAAQKKTTDQGDGPGRGRAEWIRNSEGWI